MTHSLRPLAWSRIGFGIVAFLRTTPLIHFFDPTLGAEALPLLGWPRPGLQTAAPGFALSGDTVKTLCIVRTVAIVAFTLGYRPRLAGIVAAVSGYLVVLQNAFGFTFTQHLIFVGLFVLAIGDSGTVLAVRPEKARSPRTSLWLVWSLVTSVYAWAAIAKFRRDWFDGRTLGLFFDEGKLRGPLASTFAGTHMRQAISGPMIVLTELALVPLLLVPRTRPWAVLAAVCFHVGVEGVARPDVFGWAMVALLLSFVPLDDRSENEAQLAQRA